MNSAPLSSLPTSSMAPLTHEDVKLADHIFGAADSNVNRDSIARSFKSPLIVALIVAFMSHPMSDQLIFKVYPKASENKYTMISIKMALAAVSYFILNHWTLSRA
jgi:hypothetical protein